MPDPLHPAVVHLPLGLAFATPLLALVALLAIRSGLPPRAWVGVLLLQGLVAVTAWAAVETGEDQEERVEEVVGHDVIHEHEEAAERFLLIAGLSFVASGAGLLRGPRGGWGRLLGTLLAVVTLGAGIATGRSGGALVYEHGAASVYVQPGPSVEAEP